MKQLLTLLLLGFTFLAFGQNPTSSTVVNANSLRALTDTLEVDSTVVFNDDVYLGALLSAQSISGTTGSFSDSVNIGGSFTPLQKLHVKTHNGNNGAVIGNFQNNYYGLAVESEDANLALISKDEGGHGSGIDLMEVDGGVLADKWWIGRWSSGTVGSGDSRLEFTYGTDADYTANARKFTVYKDNKAAFFDGTTTSYQLGIGTATLNNLELAFGAPGNSAQIGTSSNAKRISIGGGTAPQAANGAYMNLNGVSFSGSEGNLQLLAGNTATSGEIQFFTGNVSQRGSIAYNGAWSTNGNSFTAGAISGTTGDFSSTVDLTDYGSGTNTGTATYLLGVDASGNVIEEELGVDVGVLKSKTVSLTTGQIGSLFTTPVEILPAPGAGFMYVFEGVFWSLDYSSAWSGVSLEVEYTTSGVQIDQSSIISQTSDYVDVGKAGAFTNVSSNYDNNSIQVTATSNPSGGSSTLKVMVTYYIVEL